MYKKRINIDLLLILSMFVVCFGMPSISFSQSNQSQIIDVDSLKAVLKTEHTDSTTLSQYLKKANTKAGFTNLEVRLVIYNWVLKHAKKSGNKRLIAQSLLEKGTCYLDRDDFVNGSKYLKLALEFTEEHKLYRIRANVWSMLASMYYFNNQFKKATDYCFKVVAYAEQKNDKRMLFNVYHNLGLLYFGNGQNQQRKDTALLYMKKALLFLDPSVEIGQAVSFYTNMAGFLSEMNRYDSALACLERVLPLIKQYGTQDHYILYYHKLGNTFSEKGDNINAILNFETALSYAQRLKSAAWQYTCFFELSQSYERLGNYSKAFDCYTNYHRIKDSIVNVENFAKAADIQNQFEREKRKKEILRLHQENQLKQLKIERDQVIQYRLYSVVIGVIGVIIILLGLIVFLIRNIKQKRLSYKLLQQKNIDIQNKAEELSVQEKLIGKYQSQMNPQFIHEAIEAIRQAVLMDNDDKGMELLQALAQLMRQTLQYSELGWINLDQEKEYLQNYIDFEELLLQDPIQFKADFTDEPEAILIPPMFIQPIIEHMLQQAKSGGIRGLSIELRVFESDFLEVLVQVTKRTADEPFFNPLVSSQTVMVFQSRLKALHGIQESVTHSKYFWVEPIINQGLTCGFKLPLKYKY